MIYAPFSSFNWLPLQKPKNNSWLKPNQNFKPKESEFALYFLGIHIVV